MEWDDFFDTTTYLRSSQYACVPCAWWLKSIMLMLIRWPGWPSMSQGLSVEPHDVSLVTKLARNPDGSVRRICDDPRHRTSSPVTTEIKRKKSTSIQTNKNQPITFIYNVTQPMRLLHAKSSPFLFIEDVDLQVMSFSVILYQNYWQKSVQFKSKNSRVGVV